MIVAQFYEYRRAYTRSLHDYRGMARQSTPNTLFGKRLREARTRLGIAQDKLGVLIGLDEGTASARISRYETGIHEPPFGTAEQLAEVLNAPAAFFYCRDDQLAKLLIRYSSLGDKDQSSLLQLASRLGTDD